MKLIKPYQQRCNKYISVDSATLHEYLSIHYIKVSYVTYPNWVIYEIN